ncbi:glycoside hydrolase family 76 protein [Pholiota molesta]|nr:glycoside hydrolase family 76 protein [Pholiota molesta]
MSWKSLIALAFVVATTVTPTSVAAQAQCQATLGNALNVANRLQAEYFDVGTGQYNGGSLWTDANTLEDLHNLMLATGTDQYGAVANASYLGKAALNPNTNWQSFIGGANDDAGWIVLALWKMADYKAARGLDSSAFLNAASKIYDLIAGQWDNTCGGGVWWSTAHTYKNAITNELFLLLSAQGYLRFNNPTYLTNAEKTWAWIYSSGMRNAQGLFNDGLDSSTNPCTNNGQTTWTYNQGVIASGLAWLAAATGNTTLLDQAEITLDATITHLTAGTSILKESCDDALSGGPVCNQDQQLFKGIWTKHLQYYLDMAGSSRVAKYSGFLGSQNSAVFHYGTNANNDVGSVWYAPNQGGSIFTPKTSASGLEAYVSAAKYGPC